MSTDLQTLNTNQALQEWSARIKECRNSGMTVRNWCSEQGIRTQTFYYWQKKLFNMFANQNHPEFAEISMPAEKYVSEISAVAKVRVCFQHSSHNHPCCLQRFLLIRNNLLLTHKDDLPNILLLKEIGLLHLL